MLATHKTKTHGLYFVFLFFIQSTSRTAEQSVVTKTAEVQKEEPVYTEDIRVVEVRVFLLCKVIWV